MADNDPYKSGFSSKDSSSEDCLIVEKPCLYYNRPKGYGVSASGKFHEEERSHGNTLRMKRAHFEINSPRNDCENSPSSTEKDNNDISGNGFMTATAKLVITLPLNPFLLTFGCCSMSSLQRAIFFLARTQCMWNTCSIAAQDRINLQFLYIIAKGQDLSSTFLGILCSQLNSANKIFPRNALLLSCLQWHYLDVKLGFL